MLSGWEMLLYAGLGVVGAVASAVFIVGVSWGSAVFKRFHKTGFMPRPLQPLVGFTLLGLIGL